MNGKMVPWADANIHIMSHVCHYGSSVFEGIRCYNTPTGRVIFRLGTHIRRLIDSAKVYRMNLGYSQSELEQACREIIVENQLNSAYIRPLVYRGAGSIGVVPGDDVPTDVAIIAFEFGAYLGQDAMKNGIDACVSSWHRTTSASNPVLSKAGGHYLNSQLIGAEARRHGYGEGIAVTAGGMVSEGSAENMFVIRDNQISTPPLSAAILGGITRDAVMTLAADLGYPIIEKAIPRDLLYLADEIFMTGTAAEVTPVRSVDGIVLGSGSRGPITEKIQSAFFGLFDGTTPDTHQWLDAVQA